MLEVWNGEEDLHDRVHVAAVAKVTHASVARPVQRDQLAPRLLNDIPLPDALVEISLQLHHCLVCLSTSST